jgi:hypothetical protein
MVVALRLWRTASGIPARKVPLVYFHRSLVYHFKNVGGVKKF